MIRLTALSFAAVLLAIPAEAADCGLYTYKAEIISVYDGDTITADIDLGFHTWVRDEKLRLFGIDAPEMRGPDKAAAIASRDALRKKVLGKEVIVCTIKDKQGKYGRYLARIFAGDLDVNAWLLEKGFAKPYPAPKPSQKK